MKDDHNEQRDTSCGTVREGYISQIISFVYLIREAKIYSSAMGIDDCMVLFEKNNAKKIIIDFHEQYLHHIRTKSNDFYGADSRKLFKELLEVLGMRE